MRIDRPRTLLAAVAALLAAVGCAAALSDDGMSSFELAARVFAGEAAIAALFALWPARGPWSLRRRTLAGAVAGCSAALAPLLLIVTSARAACGCGNAANGYQMPTLFGVTSYNWVLIVIVAFPLLMAATTASALYRIRSPRSSASDNVS